MSNQKKERNVLITAKAYKMLIDEYHFQPSQLLAKLPKSNVKINSPKTNRFITVGSATFMNLLNDYTEDELMLRRDGFIESPESNLPIKVFGKTFMNLLPKYELNTLLILPRIARGTNTTGIEQNQVIENKVVETNIVKTLKQKMKVKKLNLKKLINEKHIDDMIKTNHQMAIFSTADHVQFNEKTNQESKACYYSAYLFDDGYLNSFTECTEYRGESQEFDYYNHQRGSKNVNTCEELKIYMKTENSDELEHLIIYDIDLISQYHLMLKNGYTQEESYKKIIKLIHQHYKNLNHNLFNVIKTHLWFETHARLMNTISMHKKLKINEQLVKGLDDGDEFDDQFENFEEIINLKELLGKEIDIYYNHCLDHFKNLKSM
jgi:hypothetical protein